MCVCAEINEPTLNLCLFHAWQQVSVYKEIEQKSKANNKFKRKKKKNDEDGKKTEWR